MAVSVCVSLMLALATLGGGMDDETIDRLAEQLFDRENNDPRLTWDAQFNAGPIPGQSLTAAIGEDAREKYRQRVRNGES